MCKIVIFAGTTEGRELAEFLDRHRVTADVCVATQYGERLLEENTYCRVHTGRLDEKEMCAFLRTCAQTEDYAQAELCVVDATHPYAQEVSVNIRQACAETGADYLRLLRESGDCGDVVTVEDTRGAAEFLKTTQGNVLVTTGSKELSVFAGVPDYRERIYARVLPSPEVAQACAELGFSGKHLICMQGPFTEELNTAMLRQFEAKWLVTKASGKAGGYEEKLRSAKAAGAKVVLIGRPSEVQGMSPMEVRRHLIRKLGVQVKRSIAVVGIGMEGGGTMTADAKKACETAQLLIGAKRMLEPFAELHKAEFSSYSPTEIRAYLDAHPEYEKIALLQSGDVGFYSGAKRLLEMFADEEVSVYPGISSVVYFCAKLRTAWDDVFLASLHGRQINIVDAVKNHKKVFALTGKGESVNELCEKLVYYGFHDVRMSVGESLGYPQERIRTGTAAQFAEQTFSDLCVLLIENESAGQTVTHGIADEAFIRAEVPMTKSEVRSISLSKLRLRRDSVVYDVGAGTGSVSVEAALQAADGWVYAIEKKPQAAALIRENQRKFGTDHLTVVEGLAPEALRELPAPTHLFVGGSSGNLKEILAAALEKNPQVRVVINCIALETVAEALACLRELPVEDTEIVSVSAAKAKEIGRYHMMTGQNPVYIISCTGAGEL